MWEKGQSGNPNGRPKGTKGLVEQVKRQTKDGSTLVAFAVSVLEDEAAKASDRLTALAWLADRGWGKAVQQTVLGSDDDAPLKVLIEVIHSAKKAP